jgi:16S rRNA (cytosine1402-N4)-methyltransferase
MNMLYHEPVLVRETIKYLDCGDKKLFVDCTLGGGGHVEQILQASGSCAQVIAFDWDSEAIKFAQKRLEKYENQVHYFCENFIYIDEVLNNLKITKVDGILMDLGISSNQLIRGDLGISYQIDSKLDMRMNKNNTLTAYDVINTYKEEKLYKIFKDYGELYNAKKIARIIVNTRNKNSIKTTFDLKKIAFYALAKKQNINKYLAQIFQAIRIEVNNELDNLANFLNKTPDLLSKGGRLVVISFHSLEDRIVKIFLKKNSGICVCQNKFMCTCLPKNEFEILTKKPIKADLRDIEDNPRARSACLRAAMKI